MQNQLSSLKSMLKVETIYSKFHDFHTMYRASYGRGAIRFCGSSCSSARTADLARSPIFSFLGVVDLYKRGYSHIA